MEESRIHFYQTGTFTVGNRLLDEKLKTLQSSTKRFNSLESGHRACQGCGEALGARYALDTAMERPDRRDERYRVPRSLLDAVSGKRLENAVAAFALRQRGGCRDRYGRGLSGPCEKGREAPGPRDRPGR